MKKQNIILITTDQMRADCYGVKNSNIITPNLDFLSKNGVDFENSYCTSPTCTPSRAALFTGRYPHNIGAWNIGVSLKEEEITMADWLKDLGYTNIAVGKMHFRPQMRNHGGEKGEFENVEIRDRNRKRDNTYYGFDRHFITEDDKRGKYLDELEAKGIHMEAGKGTDEISPLKEEDTQTYWIGKHSTDTIDNHNFEDTPLFMWTSFVDPHHPFDPIEKFAKLYEDLDEREIIKNDNLHFMRPEYLKAQGRRGYWPGGGEEHNLDHKEIHKIVKYYYAMITFIDQEIGKMLDSLRAKNQLENTIIVFTSDHGEYLGDHGLLKKGPFLNESLIKVPLIIYGKDIKNQVNKSIIENVDILPTILELLTNKVPYGIQGKSLAQICNGEKKFIDKKAIITYDAHDRGIMIKAYRSGDYKLVIYKDEDYGELFNLKDDPKELKNLFFDTKYKDLKSELTMAFCHKLMDDSDPLPERKACW